MTVVEFQVGEKNPDQDSNQGRISCTSNDPTNDLLSNFGRI